VSEITTARVGRPGGKVHYCNPSGPICGEYYTLKEPHVPSRVREVDEEVDCYWCLREDAKRHEQQGDPS
jgi:hypothetical protein